MAAKPLPVDVADSVIADWRTGEYSQNQLCEKYKISKGVVNKLCKGVDRDMTGIVTAGVEYLKGLQGQDDRIVTAVNDVISTKVRIASKIERFVDSAIDVGEKLLKTVDNGQEYKAIIDGVDRVSITAGINERHAKPTTTTIQNNTQNNYSQLTDDDLVREANRLKSVNEFISD